MPVGDPKGSRPIGQGSNTSLSTGTTARQDMADREFMSSAQVVLLQPAKCVHWPTIKLRLRRVFCFSTSTATSIVGRLQPSIGWFTDVYSWTVDEPSWSSKSLVLKACQAVGIRRDDFDSFCHQFVPPVAATRTTRRVYHGS
ncbi:unnamed protein product [Protopolystoma xenopodis]|uniref:Uncharacterized protein n=1 Tax=Protopolystoma xenopodis TaxID=117903 RepID=A0A3S5CLE0_9PLAT|nr:unnamed protein product [Protopolystoma xenopodis]